MAGRDQHLNRFDADVGSQGDVLRAALEAYADRDTASLEAARLVARDASTLVLTGMGSSFSAAKAGADRLMETGRFAAVYETGELLHYGAEALPAGSAVILISQSGETIEAVRLLERLRTMRGVRVLAVVNDLQSTIARGADVALPMHAGDETGVATKTFVGSYAAVLALVDALAGRDDRFVDLASAVDLPAKVEASAADDGPAREAADLLGSCDAIVVLGRGPASAVVDYDAQMLRETTVLPVYGMPAASFRHGPIEQAGASVGLVLLAPAGRTDRLVVRLAEDAADLGSPTWLLTTRAGDVSEPRERLLVAHLPEVPEAVAPLLFCVPVQQLASRLARARGREPGELTRVSKVTRSED